MDAIADWMLGKAKWYEYRANSLADLVRETSRTIGALAISGPFAVRLADRTWDATKRAGYSVDELTQLAYTLRLAAIQVDPTVEPPPTAPPTPIAMPQVGRPSANRIELDIDAMTTASQRVSNIANSFDEAGVLLAHSLDDAPPGLDPVVIRRIEDTNQLVRRRLVEHANTVRGDAAELRQHALLPYLIEGGFSASMAFVSVTGGSALVVAGAGPGFDPSSPLQALPVQEPYVKLATMISVWIDDPCSRLPKVPAGGAGWVIAEVAPPIVPYGSAPPTAATSATATATATRPVGIGVFPVPKGAGTDLLVRDPATGAVTSFGDYRASHGPCGGVPIVVGPISHSHGDPIPPISHGHGGGDEPPPGPSPHGDPGGTLNPIKSGSGPGSGSGAITGGGAVGVGGAIGRLAPRPDDEESPEPGSGAGPSVSDDLEMSPDGAAASPGVGRGALDLGDEVHPAEQDDEPLAAAAPPEFTRSAQPDLVLEAGRVARREGPHARYAGSGVSIATPRAAAAVGLGAAGATGGAVAVNNVSESRRVTDWADYKARRDEREDD